MVSITIYHLLSQTVHESRIDSQWVTNIGTFPTPPPNYARSAMRGQMPRFCRNCILSQLRQIFRHKAQATIRSYNNLSGTIETAPLSD